MKEPCPCPMTTCQTMSSTPDLCYRTMSDAQTALLYPAVQTYTNGPLLFPSMPLPLTVPYFAQPLSGYNGSLLSLSQPVPTTILPAMTTPTLESPQLTTLIYLPTPQPIAALHTAPLPTAPQPTRAQLLQNPSLVANPLLSQSLAEASGYGSPPNPWLWETPPIHTG